MTICELCGIGNTQRSTKPAEYKYKGHKITLEQSGIYCNNCDECILEPSDLRENRADLMLFNAMIDLTEAEKAERKFHIEVSIPYSFYFDDFGNVMMKIEDSEPELVMSKATIERFGFNNFGGKLFDDN